MEIEKLRQMGMSEITFKMAAPEIFKPYLKFFVRGSTNNLLLDSIAARLDIYGQEQYEAELPDDFIRWIDPKKEIVLSNVQSEPWIIVKKSKYRQITDEWQRSCDV